MSNSSVYDTEAAQRFIAGQWSDQIIPELERYIEIPALSAAFDADWQASGHLEAAVQLVFNWIRSRPVEGMTVDIQRLDGLSPLIVVEIDAFGSQASQNGSTTVLYGHVDKQPEMEGWRDDLGPWKPVRVGDRLYGRGGADDGYAAFASLTAIEALQQAGGSHGRCILLIEASEESGSPDLPAHVDALLDRLGDVSLVLCLDSGCATYDTLWLTTSLRGLVGATVSVEIMSEGLHSGGAGGIVPSTFRIMRILMDRLEDAASGKVLLDSANVEIPSYRRAEADKTAAALAGRPVEKVTFVEGAGPVVADPAEALIARTWMPSLAYVGLDGMPPTAQAGNVLRPRTSLKLSLRLPPSADPEAVAAELVATLEADPPYGAQVEISGTEAAGGWNAPDLEPWLRTALEEASVEAFGLSMQLFGEGGTIPFMGMLGEKFPKAQFVVTGVLGPESNAHGPNEFLDVAYAEKLTGCLAHVLHAGARR